MENSIQKSKLTILLKTKQNKKTQNNNNKKQDGEERKLTRSYFLL